MSILNNLKENEFEKIVKTQVQLQLLNTIKQLVKETPNDADLGKKVRNLFNTSKNEQKSI